MIDKLNVISKNEILKDEIANKYNSISNFSTYPGKSNNDTEIIKATSELITFIHKNNIRIDEESIKSLIQKLFTQNSDKFRYNSVDYSLDSYIEITRRLMNYANEYHSIVEGRK